MKLIFQLVGFLVVVVILLSVVLFYMDGKNLLSGDLADTVHSLRVLYAQAKALVTGFLSNSGIADDAADLLDEGADLIRRSTGSPVATEAPTIIEMITPAPMG